MLTCLTTRLITCLVAVLCARSVLACTAWIEEHASTLILHAHSDGLKECSVDESAYQQVIKNWVQTQSTGSKKMTSLALGRAVTYPWLSRHIADAALTKPKTLKGSKLAKEILLDPELLQRLAIPFAGTHYKVAKVSYEKILFGPAGQHSSNKHAGPRLIPFDAQLWLQLNVPR